MTQKEKNYKDAVKHYKSRDDLIPILQKVQEKFKYIPREIMSEIAKSTGLALSDIYGVVTFYRQFRLTMPGIHTIKVCDGTACHVNNSAKIIEKIQDLLGISPGETSEDGKFTLATVACLGCCSLAPAIMIDKKVYGNLSDSNIENILSLYA